MIMPYHTALVHVSGTLIGSIKRYFNGLHRLVNDDVMRDAIGSIKGYFNGLHRALVADFNDFSDFGLT